jgi:hypothetical protein
MVDVTWSISRDGDSCKFEIAKGSHSLSASWRLTDVLKQPKVWSAILTIDGHPYVKPVVIGSRGDVDPLPPDVQNAIPKFGVFSLPSDTSIESLRSARKGLVSKSTSKGPVKDYAQCAASFAGIGAAMGMGFGGPEGAAVGGLFGASFGLGFCIPEILGSSGASGGAADGVGSSGGGSGNIYSWARYQVVRVYQC